MTRFNWVITRSQWRVFVIIIMDPVVRVYEYIWLPNKRYVTSIFRYRTSHLLAQSTCSISVSKISFLQNRGVDMLVRLPINNNQHLKINHWKPPFLDSDFVRHWHGLHDRLTSQQAVTPSARNLLKEMCWTGRYVRKDEIIFYANNKFTCLLCVRKVNSLLGHPDCGSYRCSSVPLGKCWDSALAQATAASFNILLILQNSPGARDIFFWRPP